jgi:ABC-type Na+ transport system ATPase subunit NatA
MSAAPLMRAEGLRVDADGAVAVEAVTFTTRGSSVALLGEASGLLLAIAGTAAIRAGSLEIMGRDVGRREHLDADVTGIAPLDPPLPPRWTAREYLERGGRLAGMSRVAAKQSAAATLQELELGRLASTAASSWSLAERRALVLAQAVVTRPAVLVACAPLSGLSGQDAAYVSSVLAAATRQRNWIVSLSHIHGDAEPTALAAKADDVLVLASGRLVRQDRLERIERGAASYTIMLRGKVSEFREELRTRGVELSGGPQRFFVDLPAGMNADDLVALSARIGAPIVELVPRISPG